MLSIVVAGNSLGLVVQTLLLKVAGRSACRVEILPSTLAAVAIKRLPNGGAARMDMDIVILQWADYISFISK
jgi:hypothetical protein